MKRTELTDNLKFKRKTYTILNQEFKHYIHEPSLHQFELQKLVNPATVISRGEHSFLGGIQLMELQRNLCTLTILA